MPQSTEAAESLRLRFIFLRQAIHGALHKSAFTFQMEAADAMLKDIERNMAGDT